MHVHAEGVRGILRAHVRQAHRTLGDVRCVRRDMGVSVVGPKEVEVRSHQK